MLHILGSKRKWKKKTHKTNFTNLPRFSCIYISVCAFVQPHGGEFCFFPSLRLGCSGCQGLDAKSESHEMCSFSLPETILTWRPQLL